MPRPSLELDAPAVLATQYLASTLPSPHHSPAAVGAGFAALLARVQDAPGASPADVRAALLPLRDAAARAHFGGEAGAVERALACYEGAVEAAGKGGEEGGARAAAGAVVLTELRREAALLLSADPATSWAPPSHDGLRLRLLKCVWRWAAADAAASARAPPPTPPTRSPPAPLRRTLSGRGAAREPPPTWEGVVAGLAEARGGVLVPLIRHLLNETAFDEPPPTTATATATTPAADAVTEGVADLLLAGPAGGGDVPTPPPPPPPPPRAAVCPFAPATPPPDFDPFGQSEATKPSPARPATVAVPPPADDDEPPLFASLSPVAPRRPPPPPPPMRASSSRA